jgi:ligand-binding sensor domain-containing protein/anti-sigma regulatory factor (Ser/Thr protein kinase)
MQVAMAATKLLASRFVYSFSLLFVILGTTLVCGAAVPTRLSLSEYQKQDWQVEDGLPENYVRMIAQRPDGVLLLATSSGLATFDGQRFQNVPIEVDGLINNEAVNTMLYGRDHDLWIGTDGRGVLHHTSSGTINISERAGKFNERIRTMYEDRQGVLWIATQNGVERFIDGRLEAFPEAGMISGDITTPFAEDGAGGMLFVTSAGLFHWEDGAIHRFPIHAAPSVVPVAVYRDSQERNWVGTTTGVLQLVPRKNSSHDLSERFDQVPRATVYSPVTVLQDDPAGNLWIGTRRDGIWRLGVDGTSHWSSQNGLPDDTIRSLFVDSEQNLWIGMRTGGLSRWRKGALAPYGEPEGFHANFSASAFADSHGDLWLGTWGKGLFRRHNGNLFAANPPGMPIATPIRALAEDRRGRIWIGTWFEGIYRYDGRAFHHYLLGIESPGNAVSSILPDRSGGLWVGTYTGLFSFPSGEIDSSKRTPLLESKLITCLVEDSDGSILVGTTTGLFRVRDGVANPIDGMPHPYILSLIVDSLGNAWAGSKAGGLALIRQDHARPLPSTSGISPILVNTAIEDKDRHLWLGTSRGIVRLSITELNDVANGLLSQLSTVVFGKEDGMRSSESGGASNPTSTRTSDGVLWFATAKGFVHTTDVAEKTASFSPTATITGWTLSNDPGVTDTITGPHVDLEAGQPDIIFFFNAGLLSNPAHIEFRYRLTGYDAEWTSTRAHSARYRRLSPGKYHFEVQARHSGEEWLSPVATLPVRQYPHLYQSWYFYLALGILAVFIAVHLFRRRVRLMKGRIGIVLEERNRISRECHDTLMAGFAAISWQLEATAKLFRDSDSASTPAAKSCDLARSMVSHCQAEARRIIWDLRDSEEVTNILSQALSRTLTINHIQDVVRTTLDVEGDEVPLTPGCVHHLVCIGQEAVSNAIRHAHPSSIVIHLKYESDALNLSIKDDGRGFYTSDRSTSRQGHFGIPVMEERARKLGGTFRLQTSIDTGTEVTVRVSFNAMQQPAKQEHHIIRWIGI